MPEVFTGEFLSNPVYDDPDWQKRVTRVADHVKEHRTCAEAMSEQGYSTAGISANPWTTSHAAFSSGFDRFIESGKSSKGSLTKRIPSGKVESMVNYASMWWNNSGYFSYWPEYYDDIISLKSELDEPYFLWVFLMDTHNPYITPREYREELSGYQMYKTAIRGNRVLGGSEQRSQLDPNMSEEFNNRVREAYRDSVRSVDSFVKELWSDVIDDEPVIVFHADHGEAFGEHGTYGHRKQLYRENLTVPLFVYHGNGSQKIEQPVSLRRVFDIVTNSKEDVTTDISELTSSSVFSKTEDHSKFALTNNEWTYIYSSEGEELYYLPKDPNQQNNVVQEMPEKRREFCENIRTHIERLSSKDTTNTISVDDENVKDRLSSLGYLN